MIRLRCNFYYFEFQGKFKLSSCSTTALADTAAASSAAEHQSTLTSLCTLYHLIVSTGVYMHSYSIYVSVHFLHCPLVQEEHLLLLSQAQKTQHDAASCLDAAVPMYIKVTNYAVKYAIQC